MQSVFVLIGWEMSVRVRKARLAVVVAAVLLCGWVARTLMALNHVPVGLQTVPYSAEIRTFSTTVSRIGMTSFALQHILPHPHKPQLGLQRMKLSMST